MRCGLLDLTDLGAEDDLVGQNWLTKTDFNILHAVYTVFLLNSGFYSHPITQCYQTKHFTVLNYNFLSKIGKYGSFTLYILFSQFKLESNTGNLHNTIRCISVYHKHLL